MYRIQRDCLSWWYDMEMRSTVMALCHCGDVIMSAVASQITGVSSVCSNVFQAIQRKHQSSASLAFVRRIRRWPGDSPHKGSITREMFPFHDVIMCRESTQSQMDSSYKPRGPVMWIFHAFFSSARANYWTSSRYVGNLRRRDANVVSL